MMQPNLKTIPRFADRKFRVIAFGADGAYAGHIFAPAGTHPGHWGIVNQTGGRELATESLAAAKKFLRELGAMQFSDESTSKTAPVEQATHAEPAASLFD